MLSKLRKKNSKASAASWSFRREWDYARAQARTAGELAEIDAIFSRYDQEQHSASQPG